MNEQLLERVDDIERRFRGLERELRDVRGTLAADVAGATPPPRPAAPASTPTRVPPASPLRPRPSVPSRAPDRSAAAVPPRRQLADVLGEWDLLGARGLALVGGAVTLLGIAFFFVLAANHGWIGPGTRVALGGAASALVFGAGVVLRTRYGQLHSAVAAAGAGIAGGYTTLLAAVAIYGLLPEAAGLAVAAAIAALAVSVALRWSSEIVAALGLLGAAAVPALHALDGDLTAGPIAFVVLVFAAAAAVSVHKRWIVVLAATAAATFAQVLWLLLVAAPGDRGAIADTAAFFVLLAGSSLAQQRVARAPMLDGLAGSLALAAGAIGLIASLTVFASDRHAGIALLAGAAVLATGAGAARRIRDDLAVLLGALSLALAAVGTADLLSNRSLTIVWAAEAGVLAFAGMWLGETRFRIAGAVYVVLALLHAVAVEAPLDLLFQRGVGGYAAAVPTVAAVAVAAAVAGWRVPKTGRLAQAWAYAQLVLFGVASLAALDAVALGIVDVSFDVGHVVVTGIWAFAGLAAVALGTRLRTAPAATAGFVWLAVSGLKAVTFDWMEVGHQLGDVSILAVAVPLLLAGVALRVLDDAEELTILSALCALLALVGFTAAIGMLVSGDRTFGAAMLAPAGLYLALAAATFRVRRLRNLSTVLWVHALVAIGIAEAGIVQGRGVVLAYAGTAVALALLSRRLGERRLHVAALAVLGGTTLVTIAALTTPDRLVHATEHPAVSLWTLAGCVAAGAALAACDPATRARVGWFTAGVAVYATSLGILELAERISDATVATDFQRGHTAVTALWGLIGLGLLITGLLRRLPALRLGGLALFGLGLAKLFLYDLSALSSVTRALSFLAVGAFMLAGGFFLQKLSARLEGGGRHAAPSA